MATCNHRQCESTEDLSPGLQYYYMPEHYHEQTYSGEDGVLYYFMPYVDHVQTESDGDGPPYFPEDYYMQLESVAEDGVQECVGDGCFIPEDYYVHADSVAEDGLLDYFTPDDYYVENEGVADLLQYSAPEYHYHGLENENDYDLVPYYCTAEDYRQQGHSIDDLLHYSAAPEDYCQLNEGEDDAPPHYLPYEDNGYQSEGACDCPPYFPEDYCQFNESEDDALPHYLTSEGNGYQYEGEKCPVQNTAPEDGHDAVRQKSAPDDANQLMQDSDVDKQTEHTRRMIESMLDDLLGSPRGEDCNHEGEIIRPDRYNLESLLTDFSPANTTRPDHNRPPSQEHNYTAFLEADHIFFTPWAAGNVSGTSLASTKSMDNEVGDRPGQGKMMLFQPGSFFSYDIGKSKHNVTASDRRKGKQIAD